MSPNKQMNPHSWISKNGNPFIVSGPCSAETEEQVLTSAKELKNIGVNIFRAGIWKPRTRPGSFEGIGNIGLEWMQKVKRSMNLYSVNLKNLFLNITPQQI